MKTAIIGSRDLIIEDLSPYMPEGTTEIVSGGARGIDACAKRYATENNINLTEFLPQYNKYERNAPLKRNLEIIEYADRIVALWDGKSRGTKFVIDGCKKLNKSITVIIIE